MHEYEIIKKEVQLIYSLEKKIYHEILVLIDDAYNLLAKISAKYTVFFRQLETSIINLSFKMLSVFFDKFSHFESASEATYDAFKDAKLKYAQQLLQHYRKLGNTLVKNMFTQKILSVKYFTLKEIYIDEKIWKPLIPLFKNLLRD
ncbi:MAG: hypothetical protein DRO14_01005 [Thermoprotei archaeon]|nr:MAG: hypothetical protein DRO14_01005 [Thermoprotei archaeon]